WPDRYESLGELLRDALIQFKSETALIEVDRSQEKARLSYLDFKQRAEGFARWLEDHDVGKGTRVAILMSNQSKWLLSAYAGFFRGAVLVPIDYKLEFREAEALLRHSNAQTLIVEYPLWTRLDPNLDFQMVVSETPEGCDLRGAVRWEDAAALS